MLDVELVIPAARDALVTLATMLAAKMHVKRRELWVAVFPQIDFNIELSQLHDVASLAANTDGVILMAYDQHSPSTAPGPIAAYDWVESNFTNIVRQVPAGKVLLGLPAYGYRWWRQRNGWRTIVVATRDMEQGNRTSAVEQAVSGGLLWWESTAQAVRKMSLVKRFDLGGAAVWRQGLASPVLWKALRQAMGEE